MRERKRKRVTVQEKLGRTVEAGAEGAGSRGMDWIYCYSESAFLPTEGQTSYSRLCPFLSEVEET